MKKQKLSMKKFYYFFSISILTGLLLLSLSAFGQGTDNAGNYGSAWSGNGGSGFGTWSFNATGTSSQSGTFLGNTSSSDASNSNGNGDDNLDGDINTSNKAWGLYANSGTLSEAFRSFNTDMAVGDRFSISMDNGFVENGSTVGMQLQRDDGTVLFEVFFIGGQASYTIKEGSGGETSSIGFTDEGISIQIDITGTNMGGDFTYSVTLTNLNSVTSSTSSGSFGVVGQVGRLRLYNANAGSNSNNNLYFNSTSHQVGILPVTLTSFTVTPKGAYNQLAFATATELNNDYFEIQRSANGKDWQPIGNIKGAGTTEQARNYQFTDRSPLAGLNYYRLKQVDFDGAFEYSPIVATRTIDTKGGIHLLYPNPVDSELQLHYNGSAQRVRILSANGQTISEIPLYDQEGKARVPVQSLSEGLYQLLLLDESGQIMDAVQFVKE